MTDNLRSRLVSSLSDVIALTLSEAEVDGYPYAVYDMTTTPLVDKDGIWGFEGDCKIRVVSDNPNEADAIYGAILEAVEEGMRDETYFSVLDDVTKECVDGIWTIEMNYTLKQYN